MKTNNWFTEILLLPNDVDDESMEFVIIESTYYLEQIIEDMQRVISENRHKYRNTNDVKYEHLANQFVGIITRLINPDTPLECTRCNYKWWPAKPELPQTCPKCRSPYWNKERVRSLNH